MPSRKGKVLTVHEKLSNKLHSSHDVANENLKRRTGKEISFIDYTGVVADDLDEIVEFLPKKKGKKRMSFMSI